MSKKEVNGIVFEKEYTDRVLGTTGKAMAYLIYATGCDQVRLDFVSGGEVKNNWVDVTQIEGLELSESQKKPGGPAPSVPSRSGL